MKYLLVVLVLLSSSVQADIWRGAFQDHGQGVFLACMVMSPAGDALCAEIPAEALKRCKFNPQEGAFRCPEPI